ncbi:hypothetical protein [Mesorhizobium sp. M1295]|uniref:hypothetical protein n=1 Tax=Mesorhizobium sp. M1295 TaxID=2957076 RepID=UPI003336F2B1
MTNSQNAIDLAHRLAPGAEHAPAIAAPDRTTLSHGGLRRLIRDTVARLNALIIGRGDRVAIVLPNGPEMATAFVRSPLPHPPRRSIRPIAPTSSISI